MFSFGKQDPSSPEGSHSGQAPGERPDDKPLKDEPNQKAIDEDFAAQLRQDAADRRGGRR